MKPLYLLPVDKHGNFQTVIPTAIGILTPVTIGIFFGVNALLPMLIGFLLSAIHMDTSMTNTGCAWNSAKRIISVSEAGKGMTDLYKATVIGDTIGDPMKVYSAEALPNLFIAVLMR